MYVIAVVGSKSSGKTTTIEALVKGLTKQNYRVAVIKHVSEPNFTLDTKGKDTWRFRQAGANIVTTIADHEMGIMKITDTHKLSLKQIIDSCGSEGDVVFLEGFKELISDDKMIPKIVAIKSFQEAQKASNRFQNIIAFTNRAPIDTKNFTQPIIDVCKNPIKLIETVLSLINSK
jgi:molybdopterin-guanine dinucleotide biosynthesis protein B